MTTGAQPDVKSEDGVWGREVYYYMLESAEKPSLLLTTVSKGSMC